MQRDNKLAVLVALFLIAGAAIIIVSYIAEKQAKPGVSKAFLVAGSYRNVLDHGYFLFSYAIENNENRDAAFTVTYLLGESTIGSETIEVRAGTTREFARQIPSRFTDPILPAKFTIRLDSDTKKTYELSYWITRLDYS